jgi:DNA-directed RNA polymerase specialized sigma24 family protein
MEKAKSSLKVESAPAVDQAADPKDTYPVATPETWQVFYRESFKRALLWVIRHHWDTVHEDATASDIVEDAFAISFEKRLLIRRRAFGWLIWTIRDLLKKHRNRDFTVGSLGLGSSDSEMGVPLWKQPARTASSELASREYHEIFSDRAVRSLRPKLRLVYDLRIEDKTHRVIAEELHLSEEAVEKRWRAVWVYLITFMVKYESDVAKKHAGIAGKTPIRTQKAARKAIDQLPILCSKLVHLVYVAHMPVELAWFKAGAASPNEAREYLAHGLEILSMIYDQKMPDELEEALQNHRRSDLGEE